MNNIDPHYGRNALKQYSRRRLTKIYQRYARSQEWNDHWRCAQQSVDLWIRTGTGAVGAAVRQYEKQCVFAFGRTKLVMVWFIAAVGLLVLSGAMWFR